MVVNTLNTYNSDSAYVSPDDWEGIACYDCGGTCDRENSYYCPYCEEDYCERCSSYCRLCYETVCLGCGGQCPHCEEMTCPNCISKCKECEGLCCKECLDDGLCPDCIDERNNNEESENKKTEAGKTEVEVSGSKKNS